MISPRSFIYSHPPHPPSPSSYSPTTPSSQARITTTTISTIRHQEQTENRLRSRIESPVYPPVITASNISNTVHRRISAPRYDQTKTRVRLPIAPIRSSTQPATLPEINATMGKRKDRLEATGLAPASPPREATAELTRPTTPSSPVQIPRNSKRPTAHPQKRSTPQNRKPKPKHPPTPDDISPSVAALLAVTSIPRQRSLRKPRSAKPKRLTVDDVFDGQQVTEKDLSWTFSRSPSRSPMDLLLSPPEDFPDDDISVSDCNIGSALSIRTNSADSIPSLGDSFVTDGLSSLSTPGSSGHSFRGRRPSPVRKSLEPILSPPGHEDEHPLARRPVTPIEEVLPVSPEQSSSEDESPFLLLQQFKPLRHAFRSNLTASFRALRSAARSFSTINFSSIPSDDYLTRSLLTIDPNVPYTDERRPPVSEDIPSAEMRRYLNPTTSSRIETQPATVPPPGTFSASIQMQTYKVQRSKLSTSRGQRQRSSSQPATTSSHSSEPLTAHSLPPGMRQREMRENPDFIRIAVMEMAMRKNGKLDDQVPGRARWALPPRQTSTAPYAIGPNGVPARWRSISY